MKLKYLSDYEKLLYFWKISITLRFPIFHLLEVEWVVYTPSQL